jgi:hypothetical protein
MKRNLCGFATAGPFLLALAASPPAFAQKQGGTLIIGHSGEHLATRGVDERGKPANDGCAQ